MVVFPVGYSVDETVNLPNELFVINARDQAIASVMRKSAAGIVIGDRVSGPRLYVALYLVSFDLLVTPRRQRRENPE